MDAHDRRCDQNSSNIIIEAIKMHRVFNQKAAIIFLHKMGIKDSLASVVVSRRYDRRALFRRKKSRDA